MREQGFAGIKVSVARRQQVLDLVGGVLDRGDRLSMTFLNPDYARRALLDVRLKRDINTFDAVLVDGNGVRLLSPLFGFSVPERLDTDSIAPAIFREAAVRGASVFLFGCAPGVAERAADRLRAEIPRLEVAGTLHGFQDVQRGHPGRISEGDSEAIVSAINASGAGVVMVSLPTPLQQHWVVDHAGRLTAPVLITGGSYLDHVAEAGTAGYYPVWADRLSLNWLYRLGREPRRLWRRYSVEYAQLVALVVRERMSSSR